MFWDTAIETRPTSDSYNDLKIRFVEEYMVDYDANAAVIRMGGEAAFNPTITQSYVQSFMQDPLVRNLIKQKEEEFAVKLEQRDPVLLGRIGSSLYRESQTSSSGASRVAALKVLIDLFNLNKNVATANDNSFLNVVEMDKNTVIEKCKELGLPTSIYQNDFAEG